MLCVTLFQRPLGDFVDFSAISLEAAEPLPASIFGFAEFIATLAVLLIVFTITDIRYKFRIAIAPIPLRGITYYAIPFIGIATLLSDLWFTKKCSVPSFLNDQALIQGLCACVFLGIVALWVYYAYQSPPIFCERNYKEYAKQLSQKSKGLVPFYFNQVT